MVAEEKKQPSGTPYERPRESKQVAERSLRKDEEKPEECKRVTEVTRLGVVYGTPAALKRIESAALGQHESQPAGDGCRRTNAYARSFL
jgi:hypothetical protein